MMTLLMLMSRGVSPPSSVVTTHSAATATAIDAVTKAVANEEYEQNYIQDISKMMLVRSMMMSMMRLSMMLILMLMMMPADADAADNDKDDAGVDGGRDHIGIVGSRDAFNNC